MSKPRLTTTLLIAFLSIVFHDERLLIADGLQIGVAEVDITPPTGFPMAGYRDPLKARAVVYSDGDQQAAMVVADVAGISHALCLQVRQQASAKTGIPPQHIILSATHSHTAPDYSRRLYDFLDSDQKTTKDSSPYVAKLIDGIAMAVIRAAEAMEPAIVESGSVEQTTPVSFNRRFVMKDGSVLTWQRLSNPEVVRAAGPIDPEIGLVRIRSTQDDSVTGVISNFALHLDTVGGKRWSADYPYYIEQAMRTKYGEKVISIFGAGTCGDINHTDPTRQERNSTSVIGKSLAATITSALPSLKKVENPSLLVRTTTAKLPLQEVPEQQLGRLTELITAAQSGEKIEFFDLVFAHKSLMLDHLRNKPSHVPSRQYIRWGLSHDWAGIGESLPVEVTTITIGKDVAIVFLPGEVFVDLGLAIKRHSPYRTTMVIELSNCNETIYLPTRGSYAVGGYEVLNSTVKPGSGEMLVEAALKLLRESASTK